MTGYTPQIQRTLTTLLLTLVCCFTAVAQQPLRRTPTQQKDLNGGNFGGGDYDRMQDDFGEEGSYDERHGSNRMTWGRDTTKHEREIPIGVFQWKIDPRLGNIIPSENNDTVVKHYSNFNHTDGYNGEYSYLGNLGSARYSRIYMNRTNDLPFLFLQPLSYGLSTLNNSLFSNTLSPITNLSYHSCGNRQTGEDRVRAYFASNINKISGYGLKLDYLYGRGYYHSSQSSIFNSNFFGYYRGERYEMHAWTQFGHHKNAESGGIEEDRYIRNPQSFSQRFGSQDIPTMLDETYNRNDYQTYHLTHRYNMGYYRDVEVPDSLQPKMPEDKELLIQLNDSVRNIIAKDSLRRSLVLDSLRLAWQKNTVIPQEFVPVSSIIHTLNIDHLNHSHYSYDTPANYYTNHYYGKLNDILDKTQGLVVTNTLGLAMREGFKKWVKMGITAFATHKYERYTLPSIGNDSIMGMNTYKENHFSVGGEISKTDGNFLHYNANGEITVLGDDIGEFNIDGNADLNFAIGKRDTVQLAAHGLISETRPDFYMEHYHSQSAWWDNDNLNMEKHFRVEGTLSNKRSKTILTFGFENINNYTYFAMHNTLLKGADATSTQAKDYSHEVGVTQASNDIQVYQATLKQDFKAGPLNWENEITYQHTSNANALPLPKLNIYSNLYLLFRVAKVLRVELGADVRYFTHFYAPDYSANIGQFAVQDTSNPRVKIGNYPIINAYANLHIKHCRIYISVNHVNAGSGNMFLAPHYPINPMTIHWGVSWNFFN